MAIMSRAEPIGSSGPEIALGRSEVDEDVEAEEHEDTDPARRSVFRFHRLRFAMCAQKSPNAHKVSHSGVRRAACRSAAEQDA